MALFSLSEISLPEQANHGDAPTKHPARLTTKHGHRPSAAHNDKPR